MLLSGLTKARLVKRYKRFLADVVLPDGTEITCHCPNPGSMLGLSEPGMTVLLKKSADPKRKLAWSWKIVMAEAPVVVDTMLANKLVGEAFKEGTLTEFADFGGIRAEQSFGDSRFDFALLNGDTADGYLEVKSTTLIEGSRALFPDAKTERGRKHLETLCLVKKSGLRAVQFYLVGRNDALTFAPADKIDPAYGKALRLAHQAGVEIYCRSLRFDFIGGAADFEVDVEISVGEPVSVDLEPVKS